MEIHKPKPWHGWRELAKEVGTIVIGVLIALGAEQAVEWLHWQERTEKTRGQLHSEIHDMTVGAAGQLAINKCSNDMVDRLEKALIESGDDWTPPFVFAAGAVKGLMEAPKGGWSDQAWRNAQSDGTANHLPQAELLALGSIYDTTATIKAINEQEEVEMAELNSLAVLRRLDTATRAQYLRLVWRVRQDLLGLAINSRSVLQQADGLKVKRGRLEDYNPVAMGNYQRMCREFYSGKPVIDIMGMASK